MRGRARGTALLAVALVWGASGCGSVREASNAAGQATDKASICVDALRLAGFVPEVSDPRRAAEDAKKTSEELARLAGQTPDEALRTAPNDMSSKVGELGPGNLDPGSVSRWTQEKVSAVTALTRACG